MAKKDELKVRDDINARDRADIDVGDRGTRAFRTSMGIVPVDDAKFGKLSKLEKMRYRDAVDRQNRMGAAYEGSDTGTGRGYTAAEGDATRARLLKMYGMDKEAPVKKAKGGAVKASTASKRGDGIASKGKTKGKMC